jgi:hypothetical protein
MILGHGLIWLSQEHTPCRTDVPAHPFLYPSNSLVPSDRSGHPGWHPAAGPAIRREWRQRPSPHGRGDLRGRTGPIERCFPRCSLLRPRCAPGCNTACRSLPRSASVCTVRPRRIRVACGPVGACPSRCTGWRRRRTSFPGPLMRSRQLSSQLVATNSVLVFGSEGQRLETRRLGPGHPPLADRRAVLSVRSAKMLLTTVH